jgi:tryptophan-rich sensory protein
MSIIQDISEPAGSIGVYMSVLNNITILLTNENWLAYGSGPFFYAPDYSFPFIWTAGDVVIC